MRSVEEEDLRVQVEHLRTKASFNITVPRDLSEKRNRVCKTSYAGERIIFAQGLSRKLPYDK
jgi:hypothetical protein